ncbi:ATP-dependent DNA helicase pif1 [Eumeta japonica]|uniref:ATP-dependent DNA helicase n=1 Tax=Eumeta variegata TaxID=151549 RepID=A0A4C1WEM3_EUMVA|nr:ATP-dependent DNA helicase pif1 [Eumeta japonica]
MIVVIGVIAKAIMPRRKKSNLSQQSRNAVRLRNNRNQLFAEAQVNVREEQRISIARFRASQTEEQREAARETARLAVRNGRANRTDQHRENLRHARRNIPILSPPPEPLHSSLRGETPESRHFLANTQQYNECFQMASFGADIIREHGFNPTFKIQGQIHHRIGSLQPVQDAQHKFLQIYFMGNIEEQLDRRQEIHRTMKRVILHDLQQLLHEQHALVRLFKTALERMPNDDYEIVIRADKRPARSHERTFNAPTIDKVAVLVVGEKIVSSMNYYAYRLMIRQNANNHLLRYRQLLQQYCVDMYVKIERERLTFIRLNQAKLRSEEYIHLRDAISTEGDTDNVGRLTILPAMYTGSPRHMHEYAQDAMTYVSHYGRPDLFITFTCNPKWKEIVQMLHSGQTPSDRHITARVFKQKLQSLMNYIVKQRVFGTTRCWMYSIAWQKRVNSIKYICKYVTKGSDMAVFGIQTSDANDEVGCFQVGRYVNCNEAIWRIFSFPIHERYPTVVHLAVHLENGQRVYFIASNAAQRAETPPATTLTSFFENRQSDPFARTLLYSETSRYYTLNALTKKFQRRKQGDAVLGHPGVRSTDALGRIYTVHPKNDECFYLRLLLIRISSRNPDLEASEEVHNQALLLIEDMFYVMCGSLLVRLGIPAPDRGMNDAFNRELEQGSLWKLMTAVDDENGGLFFLDAPGGTGKTFLMSLILATIRARSDIAVAIASSGIAATLLESCRTAHSVLKLPLNLQTIEQPTCNIAKNCAMAKVLIAAKIIICDECTMSHKRALDRTLKDLRKDSRCFGGAII